MFKSRLLLALPLALTLTLLTIGCTRTRVAPANVSGTVTYKGQPLKGGTVTFHSNDMGIYTAPINSDGTYSRTDLPAQTMQVAIETETVNPNKVRPTYGGKKYGGKTPEYKPEGAPAMPDKATKAEAYVKIPSKYGDPKKSNLSATLVSGKNEVDFKLD